MSKTVSVGLASHLAGSRTTLATLWKITRRDGQVFGFTDHDADIVLGGLTYVAARGYDPSEISTSGRMNVDNLEVVGFLNAASITNADLEAGLWDFAAVEIARCNWADTSLGVLKLRRGEFGQVTTKGGQFVVELRGLMQYLQQTVGRTTTPGCTHTLGDAKCGVDLEALTVSGAVTGVTSRQVFTDTTLTQANSYFKFGLVTWLTGANAGAQMEVKESTSAGVVTLMLPMGRAVAAGDTFTITPGCNKGLGRSLDSDGEYVDDDGDCIGKFDNAVNFGGFAHVPGVDRALIVGGRQV